MLLSQQNWSRTRALAGINLLHSIAMSHKPMIESLQRCAMCLCCVYPVKRHVVSSACTVVRLSFPNVAPSDLTFLSYASLWIRNNTLRDETTIALIDDRKPSVKVLSLLLILEDLARLSAFVSSALGATHAINSVHVVFQPGDIKSLVFSRWNEPNLA